MRPQPASRTASCPSPFPRQATSAASCADLRHVLDCARSPRSAFYKAPCFRYGRNVPLRPPEGPRREDAGCARQAMASEQYSSPEQVIFVGRSGRSVDEIQLPESNQRRNVCQQHFVPILVPRSRKRDHRKDVQYCSAALPFKSLFYFWGSFITRGEPCFS